MERRQFGKPRRIAIGTTAAHCVRCGAEEFVRANRKLNERTDTLFCSSCGEEHYYSSLLSQIAASVIARSEKLLEELEKRRRQPSPKP